MLIKFSFLISKTRLLPKKKKTTSLGGKNLCKKINKQENMLFSKLFKKIVRIYKKLKSANIPCDFLSVRYSVWCFPDFLDHGSSLEQPWS